MININQFPIWYKKYDKNFNLPKDYPIDFNSDNYTCLMQE